MGKRALGKGLEALINSSYESMVSEGMVQFIKIDTIAPNRYQPRKNFDNEKIEELANSIKENGLIQPVIVRRNNGEFEIIVGERRVKAAKQAGLTEVPAIIKDYSEEKILELALIENIQREDLNPVEEANAYKLILERDMITQEELSKRVGKSRSYIANMVRILDLPADIQEYVSRGTISVGQAKVLVSIEDKTKQAELVKKIVSDGLSVREVEKLARKKNVPRGTKSHVSNPFIEAVEEKLRNKLGTKVTVDYRKGRGSIRIEFYSDEELEKLIEEIS